jgi:hypothetical protein
MNDCVAIVGAGKIGALLDLVADDKKSDVGSAS